MMRHAMRSVLALTLVALTFVLVAGCKAGQQKADAAAADVSKMAVGNPHAGYCPVMGGKVDADKAIADPNQHSVYKGKVYLFCCAGCKPEFEKDPEKFIATPAAPKIPEAK